MFWGLHQIMYINNKEFPPNLTYTEGELFDFAEKELQFVHSNHPQTRPDGEIKAISK